VISCFVHSSVKKREELFDPPEEHCVQQAGLFVQQEAAKEVECMDLS
jgi:hypothetical protein